LQAANLAASSPTAQPAAQLCKQRGCYCQALQHHLLALMQQLLQKPLQQMISWELHQHHWQIAAGLVPHQLAPLHPHLVLLPLLPLLLLLLSAWCLMAVALSLVPPPAVSARHLRCQPVELSGASPRASPTVP
jgi:hypothetical protein